MGHSNKKFYRILLDSLYRSGIYNAAAPFTRGEGAIFTLHQVCPKAVPAFSPNSILKVTPDFLEETIITVLQQGYDVITLDEMTERLKTGQQGKPYVVFTFDDGYRDNKTHAVPLFEKYKIPMTIYIVSDYSSHKGELWWLALEEIIASHSSIMDPLNEGAKLASATAAEKYAAFETIYWRIRHGDQQEQRRIIRRMATEHDYDIDELTRREIMNWEELRELSKNEYVNFAAHTKSHYAMAHLTEEEARAEVMAGIEVMQKELGTAPAHFSYPYGDCQSAGRRDFQLMKELGLKTAVTTRKGVLHSAHKDHMMALPRISLNGEYQENRYIKLFLSGLPFLLRNGGRTLNVN
ncbi:MAG: hypothetical protein DHS20C08_11990 [Rhodomicrobium sp.]|nr:MAG: hypothetical protein DHS20C08_11990 [Rhodomicrobium sp.]